MKTLKHKNLVPTYIKGLVAGTYTLSQASASTGYSVRWLWEMKQQYLREGFAFLEHKNKGRVPPNKIKNDVKNKIVALYATPAYAGINFKYFTECLEHYEGISVSYASLRNIMAEFSIRSPEGHKTKKKKKVHRPRVRRDNFGDLLQIDGTPYAWFHKFGNNKRYCIVGAIDDATSQITGLYMTEYECLYGYLEILRQTIQKHGVPREIYSDRAAIFCVTPRKKQNLTQWEELAGIHDKRTQWQRILSDLGINQILAWSPEAKGRVERMWHTLQDRLPTELFLAGCDTVEKANRFLEKYPQRFNKQFAVKPMKSASFFLPCEENLDEILAAQIDRRTDSHGCFKFHSYTFAVEGAVRAAGRDVIVHISERGLYARFRGDPRFYSVRCLDPTVTDGAGETMPQVVGNIIYRYMFAFAKEISA